MTQRVFMVPLRLMMNILAVRIAKKDVSTPAENVEALCVGMVREKSLARMRYQWVAHGSRNY